VNGKAAKRIRIAVMRVLAAQPGAGTPTKVYKALKRDYRRLPYHRRGPGLVEIGIRTPPLPHSEVLIRWHEDNGREWLGKRRALA
jgi:hypothetical protein